jgi:hypothetical protein
MDQPTRPERHRRSVITTQRCLIQVDRFRGDVYWSEGRPIEGGRTQLVRRSFDGITTDLLPDGMDARTAVHEYGGAAWWVRDGVVWFTNWADQRLYRIDSGVAPVAVTPVPAVPRGDRYADGDAAPGGGSSCIVRSRGRRDR